MRGKILVGSFVAVGALGIAVAAPKMQSTPIEKKKLTVVSGKPFEKAKAKVNVLPVKSGGVFVTSTPLVNGTAVIGTAPRHWGMPTEWSLVDLKTGQKKAKFKTLGEGSAATKSAVIAFGDTDNVRPALLSLVDGKVVEPQVTMLGAPSKEVRIVVDARKPVTWVFGRRASDGRPFHMQWKDTTNPKLDMLEEMPFWPNHFSGKNGVQAWTDDPKMAARDCDRVVFDALDPWRCRPLPNASAAPQDLLEECARNDGDTWIVDDCGGAPPLPCNKSRALLMSPDPSRALAVCTDDPKHPRFALWSPKHMWVWDDDASGSWGRIIPERAPHSVAGLELFSDPDAPVKRWVDVQKGVEWTGPPMRVLRLSEHREERRRLVQPPDKNNELWVLDIDAGTLEPIAKDIDCDQPLYTYAHEGDRVTVECMPKAAGAGVLYKDEARLAAWKWVEVISITSSWHVASAGAPPEVFESCITPDGTVVGTKRGKPSSLAIIETP